jgi:hypothetical protein
MMGQVASAPDGVGTHQAAGNAMKPATIQAVKCGPLTISTATWSSMNNKALPNPWYDVANPNTNSAHLVAD